MSPAMLSEEDEEEIKEKGYPSSLLVYSESCPCGECSAQTPIGRDASPLSVSPILLSDASKSSADALPKRFREARDAQVSASAQFSLGELRVMLEHIRTLTDREVMILDLRLEPHGFIGDHPFSWYRCRNLANFGKSGSVAMKAEMELLDRIRLKEPRQISLHKVRTKFMGSVYETDGFDVVIESVSSEEEMVLALGAMYTRLVVLDHHHPQDPVVDEIIRVWKFARENDLWLHVHCRGGRGRSTTAMMLFDILDNPSISCEELMERQIKVGGSCLWKLPRCKNKHWKMIAMANRWAFIQDFLHFVSCDKGFLSKSTWSSWHEQLRSPQGLNCRCSNKFPCLPSLEIDASNPADESSSPTPLKTSGHHKISPMDDD